MSPIVRVSGIAPLDTRYKELMQEINSTFKEPTRRSTAALSTNWGRPLPLTLTADDFARRYGWKNDPKKAAFGGATAHGRNGER